MAFDYHAILIDRVRQLLEFVADHRAHAVVELSIRDIKARGLADLLSGTNSLGEGGADVRGSGATD